jgi:hypothetical protein
MSAQPQKEVPTGIKVIAWTWIITAALLGASAVLGLMMQSVMDQVTANSDVPPGVAALAAPGEYTAVATVLQLVLAALALWSGIALLRLRAWARLAVEILCWLALAWTIGFGIFFIYVWNTIAGEMAQEAGIPMDQNILQGAGLGAGIVLTLVFAVPFLLMIRYLRGARARAATAPSTPRP